MDEENKDFETSARKRVIGEMFEYAKRKFVNLRTDVYFIPEQSFRKTKYTCLKERSSISHQVLRQEETPLDDFSSDRAEDDVTQCLRHITRSLDPQPMAVLLNYFFGNFLVETVEEAGKPATKSAPSKKQKMKARELFFPNFSNLEQGIENTEVDALIISPKFGIVVMETKAIGFQEGAGKDKHSGEENTTQPNSVNSVSKLKEKTEKATKQLSNCEKLLREVLAGFPGNVPITKCLALPFVPRSKVQALIEGDLDAAKAFSKTFETSTPEDTLAHFLCADDLASLEADGNKSERSTENEALARKDPLLAWWANLTKKGNLTKGKSGDDGKGDYLPCESSCEGVMSTDDYEKLLSMFCGPYSKLTIDRGKPQKPKSRRRAPRTPFTEQVRTAADCIHLTGLRFSRSILLPDQADIMESADRFVFLVGPPGSGKTLLLGLKAEEWARAGCNVVIVRATGTGWGSLVSSTLHAQVTKALTAQENSIHAAAKKKSAKPQCSKPGQTSHSTIPPPDKPETITSKIPATEHQAMETDCLGQTSADKNPGAVAGTELPGIVRCAEFSKSTDSQSFMETLFEECKGRPLRIIVDECPIKVNASRLHSQLNGVRNRLAKARLALLHTTEEGAKAAEGLETKSDDRREEAEGEGADNSVVEMASGLASREAEGNGRDGGSVEKNSGEVPTTQERGGGESLSEGLTEKGSGMKDDSGDVAAAKMVNPGMATANAAVLSAIKVYMDKIQRHLSVITERLAVLQPANKRPLVTQSAEWKLCLSNIQTICREMHTLVSRVEIDLQALFLATKTDLPTSCLETETELPVSAETELPASSLSTAKEAHVLRNPDDVEKYPLIKALKEAEAQTLDASGLLFNVETAMDFFVIDDILVSMATQHKEKDVQVWASGIYPSYGPQGFVQRTLKRCLRCPPKVQKVLEYVEKDISGSPGFSYQCSSLAEDRFLFPAEGGDIKLLPHGSHNAEDVMDCSDCGDALADYLQLCLREGEGLGLEDVIIAGSFDIDGYDCKLTQTLIQRGVCLQYVDDVMAPPPYPDKASVIGGSPLQGLEAKIVVFLPDVTRIPKKNTDDPKQFREELPDWLKNLGRWNRCHLWFVASRCLSQLVVFSV